MAKRTTKQRIREEVKADQARYDDVTRRLEAAIARLRRRAERASSSEPK
jgi:hypothetical protein